MTDFTVHNLGDANYFLNLSSPKTSSYSVHCLLIFFPHQITPNEASHDFKKHL